ARRARGDARGARVVGLSRHGQPDPHHLLRRRRDRRHRLGARRARRGPPRRRRRYFRQGVLSARRRRAGLCPDGARAAVQARGPVQGDVTRKYAKTKMVRGAIFFAAALALALFPLVGGKFGVDYVTKTMVFAIFAL